MNLNNVTTRRAQLAELAGLIATGDPRQWNVLWVDRDGEVYLDAYSDPSDGKRALLEARRIDKRILFELEVFQPTPSVFGDVGPMAAEDERWVDLILRTLLRNWPKPDSKYIRRSAMREP